MLEKHLVKSECTIVLYETRQNQDIKESVVLKSIELMLHTMRYLIFIVAVVLIVLILVVGGYGEIIPEVFNRILW